LGVAKISKDLVFITASRIHSEGQKPTVSKVRARLGEGSTTTVHKYLTEWKMQHLNGVRLDPVQLEQKLAQQLKINENLTAEFLNSSTLVAVEQAENAKLRARVLELETKLAERERAHQEMLAHSTFVNNAAKESFDKSMEMLAGHLAAINEQAIRSVQETGHHFDEKIIENKLAMRVLSEQLAIKDKELKRLKALEIDGLLSRKGQQVNIT
jgi:hypothetical protein